MIELSETKHFSTTTILDSSKQHDVVKQQQEQKQQQQYQDDEDEENHPLIISTKLLPLSVVSSSVMVQGTDPLHQQQEQIQVQQEQQQQQLFLNHNTNHHNKRTSLNNIKVLPSPLYIKIRYVFLSFFVILLSVLYPGTTTRFVILEQQTWMMIIVVDDDNNTAVVENTTTRSSTDDGDGTTTATTMILLFHLFILYVLILISFFRVHGSHPGILTKENMTLWYNKHYQKKQGEEEEEEQQQQSSSSALSNDEVLFLQNKDHQEHDLFLTEPTEIRTTTTATTSDLLFLNHHHSNHNKNDTNKKQKQKQYCRKYCNICQFNPPYRSHHCKVLNVCIAKYDHYCYFIGTCIGECNHSKFYLFIVLQTIGFLYCCSILQQQTQYSILNELFFPQHQHQHETTNYYYPILIQAIITKCYVYLLTFASVTMVLIHTMMIVTNTTTFEFSKSSKYIDYLQDSNNGILNQPFNQHGIFYNIYEFFYIQGYTTATMLTSRPITTATTTRNIQQKKSLCSFDCTHVLTSSTTTSNNKNHHVWIPMLWQLPKEPMNRMSEDWYHHPFQNKYWNCC